MNQYNGVAVRTSYFVRAYVTGTASDKIPLAKYRNPAFAQAFAFLMGEAAALDMVVGRRSSVTKELLFDKNYEVVKLGDDGIPVRSPSPTMLAASSTTSKTSKTMCRSTPTW